MKKVLYIDLNKQEYKTKTVTDLKKYIGGVGVGIKLLHDNIKSDPVIFSVGPLNGLFPYASKTSIVFHSGGGVEDLYLGGSLSTRIRFAGLDAIVLNGKASEPINIDILDEEVNFRSKETDLNSLGLPGKKSVMRYIKGKFFLDEYFITAEDFLENKLLEKNVAGIVVTGTKTENIQNKEKYEELYKKLLLQTNELSVQMSQNPSCSGCPMGCGKSRIGEIGGNVLVHSLVACTYAEKIYSNIGVIFSCLNVLGYDYTHEDIESLPVLIQDILKELSE